ncbi:MAG TPA: hypothetical protein VJU86_08245 [Pyrinomonadaceae bacterium]|nr:hypothetical protein [Pyrinomonadaceae bacterium]
MKTLGLASALGWLVVLASSTALAPVSQGQRENGQTSNEINRIRPCPAISVSCPSDLKDGEPLLFFATIKGADPATVTYSWTISEGTIVSGQGTQAIKLKPPGETSFAATVTIGGLDPACGSTASCAFIICPAPPSRKFDSFSFVPGEEVTKRAGKFADALVNEPGAMGYVLSYARRGGAPDEAKVIAERAKAYLVSERGIQVDRIVVEGGAKDQTTIELWVVPSGATPPKASDDVNPGDGNALPDKKTATNPTRP